MARFMRKFLNAGQIIMQNLRDGQIAFISEILKMASYNGCRRPLT